MAGVELIKKTEDNGAGERKLGKEEDVAAPGFYRVT